ncbi:MAG: hypothetical protein KC593_13620 [Myxococcales bacterium]|nr:hypothetical protein [Myxococcales bacterium]MCB9629789.1 hypothetical protein [Sandaracinaceae bacterium]
MTRPVHLSELLELLHHDTTLFERLCEEGHIERDVEHYTHEQAETARVVGTLIHELDVNWAGAEVILRMRSELVATRRQVTELLVLLKTRNDE